MKFKITRVSDHSVNVNKPCPQAVEVSRAVESQAYAYGAVSHLSDDWYTEGFNHRVETYHGYENTNVRDYYQVEWEIEINTLDDLVALISTEGEIIINADEIRIYDEHES